MSGALIRGGVGSEIALRDILPAHLRNGLASRDRCEPIARDYEAKNPGSVVVCDWELFDDQDIAAMNKFDAARATADRERLASRRAAAAKRDPEAASPRGGDPSRMREMLRRAKNELAHLDLAKPDQKKRFLEITTQINELEVALGQPETDFSVGKKPVTLETQLTEKQKKEIEEKSAIYRTLPIANRRASIEAAVDPVLTQRLFDVETEQDLRDLLAMKLVQLGAVAAA